MLKVNKIIIIFLLLFISGAFSATAKEVKWNFDNERKYVYNKNKISVFENQARTKMVFTQGEAVDSGKDSWGTAWVDFDQDGLVDIYIVNWEQNQLWINKGNNKFEQKNIEGDEGHSQAVVAEDFDKDGDIDIYVANFNGQNKLWLNDGKANFKLFEIEGDGGYSYGVFAEDFNSDGLLDIYVRNNDGEDKLWLAGFYKDDEFTPSITVGNSVYFKNKIDAFEADSSGNNVKFQISINGGENWYFWNNSEWMETENTKGEETSTLSEIDENIGSLAKDDGRFKWRAFLNSNGILPAILKEVRFIYDEENYPPEIQLEEDVIEINEGLKDIAKIEVVDKNKKQKVYYSLDGMDANLLQIGVESGELSFKNNTNYKNPMDSNKDNVYEIAVIAEDNGNPSEKGEKVLKVKVKDLAFEIVSNGGKQEVELNLNEEIIPVTTIETRNGSEVIYYIKGGDDKDLFVLDNSSGELSFREKPDYEKPKDSNKDNIYEVEIIAIDGNAHYAEEITQKFFINIVNITENIVPNILDNTDGTPVELNEENKIVAKIKAEDANGDIITFEIFGGDDAQFFEINTETGELSFKDIPDYLNPQDFNTDNIYETIIRVSDSGEPMLSVNKKIDILINHLNQAKVIDLNQMLQKEVCKDSKAVNFSSIGIHKENLCNYKLDLNQIIENIKNQNNCPINQTLTQKMIIGDRDEKYSGWERSVVDEVKILQEHLRRLGADISEVDGIFGKQTENAVKEIQRKFGLNDNGMVNDLLISKINSSCLIKIEDEDDEELEDEIELEIDRGFMDSSIKKMMWLMQDIINKIR